MSPIFETATQWKWGVLKYRWHKIEVWRRWNKKEMSRYVTQYKMAFKSMTAFENSYEMTKNLNSMPFFRFNETFPNVRGHLIRVS